MRIDYESTLIRWNAAVEAFRLNLSEIARNSGISRQHVTNILSGASVPSMPVAQRVDKAIEEAVDRRKEALSKIVDRKERKNAT